MSSIRIGQGYDVHELVSGRKLILGSLEIPYEKGLKGHSDADVLLHAIIDAVLGALAWGDIGSWFPDTDSLYSGVSSAELFRNVWQEACSKGWSLVNLDSVVMAQKPKLRPFIDELRVAIAELFDVSSEQISVKATTTEGLGFVGRGEGIAASAVVLLSR